MAVGYELSNVVSLFRRTRTPEDWSAQELANFYKVEHVLLQNGLAIDVDRGVTDEGDPWFVFCHCDGDVFLHFARLGGGYLVAGPNIPKPVWNKDFNNLLRDLQDRVPLAIPARTEGGATLLMHPSVLLVAAVAALFYQSSSLKAEEAGELDGRGNDLRNGSSKLSEFQVASLIAVIAFMASAEGLNSQSGPQNLAKFEMALDVKSEKPLQVEDSDLEAVFRAPDTFQHVEAASEIEADAVEIATSQVAFIAEATFSIAPEVDIVPHEQQEPLRETRSSSEPAVQRPDEAARFAAIEMIQAQTLDTTDADTRAAPPNDKPVTDYQQALGQNQKDEPTQDVVALASEPEEVVISWDQVKFFKTYINGIPVLIENTPYNLPNGPTADMVPLEAASNVGSDDDVNVVGLSDSSSDAYAMM